ncbi:MAG: glycosyltransferase [Fibromonadaceae bacterium]|jgi:spore maturation protein CgeB|nr:glycosyltransferase [Fibromonadaceae bacterium]
MRCEHFRALSGELSARVYGSNFERLLHSAIKPEQEKEWFKPQNVFGVVFAFGTGLGYHLEFLNNLPQGKVQLVVLCDAFTENLDAVKKKLSNLPVVFFNEDLSQFADTFKNNKVTVIRHPAAARYCEAEGETALSFCLNQDLQNYSQFSILNSQLPIALPFGSHFLQQEILNAFKELQVPCVTLPQESENPSALEFMLMELFQKNMPRLVLCVNAKGIDFEGVLLSVCKRFSVPVHIWFVDDPRPIACLFSKPQCENMFAWSWERAYIPWLKQKGFAQAEWLPLAGDSHLFCPQNKKPVYDLMFTGSAMAGSFLDNIWKYVQYNRDEALPIAQNAAINILTGKMSAEQIPGDTKEEAWFASYCIHLASAEKRRLCLEPLLNLGLQLAGDSQSWKAVFGASVKTLPDIDYRKGLCSHYSQGNIHINITSCQMPTAVNQRVFDIPLCERFVISDAQNDLLELFPKDAICTANSPEEYAELVKFYRENPNAKNGIIRNAREHVLREHLYRHRVSSLYSGFFA